MFAVIKSGGHQYRVEKGSIIDVDLLHKEVGSKLTTDQVLMVGDDKSVTVGEPLVSGAKVEFEIKNHDRKDKVLVFKYKRRKNYKVMRGHRQGFTTIEVKSISK